MNGTTLPYLLPYLGSFGLTVWLGVLAYRRRQMPGVRSQTLIIIAGLCISFAATVLSLVGFIRSGQGDLTSLIFVIANLVLAWGLLRRYLFRTTSLARDAVIENLGDPIITIDPEDRLVDLNPAAARLLGQPAAVLLGTPAAALPFWKDLLPPGPALEKSETEIHLEGGQIYEVRQVPVAGEGGALAGRVLVLHDITARRQAEFELRRIRRDLEQRVIDRTVELAHTVVRLEGEVEERRQAELALGESEEKFRAMIEQASESFVLVDEQGCVIEANPACERLFGLQRSQVIGRPFWEVIAAGSPGSSNPDLEEWLRSSILESVHTGQSILINSPLEIMVRQPGGPDRWILQTVFPIRTRSGFRLGSISRDITQTKLADLAVRESEEKFRSFMEQSSDGFLLLDEQGLVIEANPASLRLANLEHNQVAGRPFWELTGLLTPGGSPERIASFRQDIQCALQSGKSPLFDHPVEIQVCTAGGCDAHLLQTFFPIRTRRGFRIGSISRDVTSQKQAEKALRQSEEKFRSIIEQSSDGFLLLDEQGAIIETNPAYLALTGLEQAEILGRPFVEVTARSASPEAAAQIQQRLDPALQDGDLTGYPHNLEVTSHPAEGRTLHLLQTIFPIHTSAGLRLASFTRDISEQKLAQQRVQAELEKLNSLRLIDVSITSGREIGDNLNVVLEQAVRHLGLDAGRILLLNEAGQELSCAVWTGFKATPLGCPQLNHPGSLAWTAIRKGERVTCLPDPAADGGQCANGFACTCFGPEGFRYSLAVPLVVQGSPRGAMEVFLRRPFEPDPDWLNYLDTLAGQAAVAVDNAYLMEDLQRTNQDLTEAYEATIAGWSQALELRDKETKGHSERVTYLATELALRMGMNSEDLVHFRRGVLLHDIGKMGVPDSILLKPGPLTDDEWVVMRMHVQYARNLLAGIPYLRPAIDVALYHHERWDGGGYPAGLKAEEIPLGARIFSVLDVWDALRSDRPYRPAWERQDALRYIKQLNGKQFDPQVVQAFLALVGE